MSKPWQFKPGQVANPVGRPKGSRNKLGEDFLAAMHADFTKHGIAAIRKARKEDATQYIKTIASLLPREMTLKVDPLDEMTDAELLSRLRQLDSLISLALGRANQAEGTLLESTECEELRAIRPDES